jgi:integrase
MSDRTRGTGSIFKVKGKNRDGTQRESKNWYIAYWHNGKQHRVATGTSSKMRAEQQLTKLLGQIANGITPATASRRLRYDDVRNLLLDMYEANGNRSLRTTKEGTKTLWNLPNVDKFFAGKRVSEITTDVIAEYRRKRGSEGSSGANINRELGILRRMLYLARKRGKFSGPFPDFQMVRETNVRRGFLGYQSFRNLLNALPSYLRPLVLFLYTSGVRKGEAQAIQWDQIELTKHPVARLFETKNGEPRTVPLASELVTMLNATPREKRKGPVFYQGLFRKTWVSACIACKLGHWEHPDPENRPKLKKYVGLIVHDLRRSSVRNMVRAGVPERVAMSVSGHKTRSIFDRYNIVSTDDLQNAMLAVENSEAKTLQAAKVDEVASVPALAKAKQLPARAESLEASSIQL